MDRPPDLQSNQSPVQDNLPTVEPDLVDLAPEVVERIRLFMAERSVKGGASPADIADLYTSPAIADDALATRYLDRQFVEQQVLVDWRDLQDRVSAAFGHLPTGATSTEVLAALDADDIADRRE